VEQHRPGCIWGAIYKDQPEKPVATSLFGVAGTAHAPSGDYPDGEAARGGPADLNYHRLCTLSAARAGTDSFRAVNPSRSPRTQPTIAGFLSAWEAVLRSWAFEGGLDAFGAARAEGCELKIGIVLDQPGLSVAGISLLSGLWWEGSVVRPIAYAVPADVLAAGCGRIRQRQGVLPPPYLVAVAVTPDGVIRHIWVVGIWTDGVHLVFTASGRERRHAARIRARGGILYVPLRREEMDRLAPVLPATAVMLTWLYCPDAVVWWPFTEEPEVIEVRGFEPGTYPDYDRDFEAKLPWYQALGPCYLFRVDDAWQDRTPAEPFAASAWRGPPVAPGWASEAALGHWRDLVARLGAKGCRPAENTRGVHP
jgi:hypothetical protein